MHFIYLLTASIYWVLKVHWFHCKISVYICSVFFEFILKSFDHQTIKNWIFDFCRRLIIWCQSFLIGPRIRNMSSHVIWSVCLIYLLTILKKSQIKSNQIKSNAIPLFLLFHRFCVPQPIPYLHIYYFASTSLLLVSAHRRISTSAIYCSGPL